MGTPRQGSFRHSRNSQSHFAGTWQCLAVTGKAAQFTSVSLSQSIKYASDQGSSSRNMQHLGGNLFEIVTTCACLFPELASGLNSHSVVNHIGEVQKKRLSAVLVDNRGTEGKLRLVSKDRTQSCCWNLKCSPLLVAMHHQYV